MQLGGGGKRPPVSGEEEADMADDYWRWTAVETARAIRTREVSAAEVVEAHLARLDDANPAINAVVVALHEEARAAAAQADRAVQAGGTPGPLHGVPVTIKENVDQAGQATTNGVAAYRHAVAATDSPPVANLRKAGAIIIGRTNTPEFSIRWHTDNALRGATRNPWDPRVVPGGSSGGAAAAVAAGIGAIAQGNDAGGSLRYPAYCCGVATIKPTLGRVPAWNPGAWEERPPAFQLMSVQGPIARRVADLRPALAAMAARDPRDPWWVPAPLELPPPASPIRVAVTVDPGGGGVDPAVAAAVRQAAESLVDAGYAVEEVEPPLVQDCASNWALLQLNDVRLFMADAIRAHGSEPMQALLEAYQQFVPVPERTSYAVWLADRTRLLRAWLLFLEQYPLVLGPVSALPPLPVGADMQGIARVHEIIRAQRLLVAANTLGLPAAAVPTGLSGGVPIGVQVIGSRYREDLCLAAAETIERAAPLPTPVDPVP
jgi:amidase